MSRMLTRFERLRRQAKAIVARQEAKDVDRKAKERLFRLSVTTGSHVWITRAVKASVAAHKEALKALRRHNALITQARYQRTMP